MTMTLAVTQRDRATNLEALRANGSIPAVIYGRAQTPITITMDEKEFDKIRKEAGEATVLALTGLAESVEALIKEVDFNPVKQRVMHVDFYAIEKGKEITTHVPLHFVGEAPVEESHAGSVTKIMHEVEVSCQPAILPNHIDVDISELRSVECKIHVSDLKVGVGVKINAHPEDSVVVVTAAKQTPAGEGTAVGAASGAETPEQAESSEAGEK